MEKENIKKGISSYEEDWVEFQKVELPKRMKFYERDGRHFDILFSQQFDRQFLDYLYNLTNKIRKTAKDKKGMNFLQSLLSHRRAMLYFVQPSTRTFLSFANACDILGFKTSQAVFSAKPCSG
jgi:aspartate carbamoyltransferase catalytic subunit